MIQIAPELIESMERAHDWRSMIDAALQEPSP